MKRLYLIRHAKSSWEHPEQGDHERTLNKRGENDAHEMADWIKSQKIHPDFMVSSDAARAAETAKIFAKTLHYPENKIKLEARLYDAVVKDLIDVLQTIPDKYNHVFLFGHVPSLNLLANYLCDDHLINIPTCGVYCVEMHAQSWGDFVEATCKMAFYKYPKHHDENPFPLPTPAE